MLEMMKAALARLTAAAKLWIPIEIRDAMLAGASKTDELERRIAKLEGRDHG